MDGFGGGESWALIGNGDSDRIDRGILEACLEVQFVGGGGPNRILLVSDDAIIVLSFVVVVDIGGVACGRFIFQDAPHGAIAGSAGRWTTTNIGGVEAAAKLLMRVGDLGL